MSLSIIYQLIQTPRGFYLYDRSINTIVSVSESEFNELKNICDNVQVDNSPVVKRLRQKGLLKANDVKIIKHPYTSALPHFSSRCLSSLVLQVTQQCNLRCSYCAFSGLYHNRTHNSERMNFETARKAIDFFIERSFESESLHLGFYGGEPLLEIELIKKCVDYIQKNVEGKRITFGITTNGTLLTGEVLQFLYDNDFSITISLDGPKEDHDACRKFANGKGSFDIVVKNISEAKRLYPEYAEIFIFSTVISPRSDLNHVLSYFKTDEVFSDSHFIMTPLVEVGLKDEITYTEKYHLVRKYEYLKFLLHMIGKIDEKYISRLVIHNKKNINDMYRSIQEHVQIPQQIHHGGPCIPGMKKLFVMTDGRLFPCEKVSESNSCSQIGTLDQGFDIGNMTKMLNIGELTESECKDCWAILNCRICVAELEYDADQTSFQASDKSSACKRAKDLAYADLYELCVLHELGYRLNEEAIIL